MYQPKLPIAGVSFFALALSPLYNFSLTMLFVITISIILFRLIRLLIKEGKLKNLLSIALILFSIFIAIYSFEKYQIQLKTKTSQELLINYNKTLESIGTLSNSNTSSLATSNSHSLKAGEVLGKISIEKLNLELPIIEDASKENLWLGAAHIKGTSLPGEKGNSFLASHYIKNYGKLFNRLKELNIGDNLTLTLEKGNSYYEVYDIKIVSPEDMECFKKQNGDYNLSLVTCTVDSKKRLIVYFKKIT